MGEVNVASSDETIVKVKDGIMIAVSAGEAVIRAKIGKTSAETNVIVVADATAEQVNGFGEEYINIYGRSYIQEGRLNLDQTANAVEIGIGGGNLSVTLSSTANSYMRIYIDESTEGKRLNIPVGIRKYMLASELEEGYHKIRLAKATEMQDACWDVLAFEADRFTCVREKSDLKIEFIGDSISVGYGVLGDFGQNKSVENSDCTKAYPFVAAQALNADYSIIAWSGICTKAYHWEKNINMAELYKHVSFTNTEEYAFDFSPDIIVINLGTNEASYLSRNLQYADRFPADYYGFLKYVREKNPESYIICLYGMMGGEYINRRWNRSCVCGDGR